MPTGLKIKGRSPKLSKVGHSGRHQAPPSLKGNPEKSIKGKKMGERKGKATSSKERGGRADTGIGAAKKAVHRGRW